MLIGKPLRVAMQWNIQSVPLLVDFRKQIFNTNNFFPVNIYFHNFEKGNEFCSCLSYQHKCQLSSAHHNDDNCPQSSHDYMNCHSAVIRDEYDNCCFHKNTQSSTATKNSTESTWVQRAKITAKRWHTGKKSAEAINWLLDWMTTKVEFCSIAW